MNSKIEKCKYCNSNNIVIGYQQGFSSVFSGSTSMNGSRIIHEICGECGSILHSRLEDTSKLKKFSPANNSNQD